MTAGRHNLVINLTVTLSVAVSSLQPGVAVLVGPEGSVACLQDPAPVPNPEPYKFSPQSPTFI